MKCRIYLKKGTVVRPMIDACTIQTVVVVLPVEDETISVSIIVGFRTGLTDYIGAQIPMCDLVTLHSGSHE